MTFHFSETCSSLSLSLALIFNTQLTLLVIKNHGETSGAVCPTDFLIVVEQQWHR